MNVAFPDALIAGYERLMATKRRHPPTTVEDLLGQLSVRLPSFTSELHLRMQSITPPQ